jgi:hypothetical protein
MDDARMIVDIPSLVELGFQVKTAQHDNKANFFYARALQSLAFALRALAEAVRTRIKKSPHHRAQA